ncbi:MAG TPA: class I SAM-dependent methyltransferase [Candidatus Saccharimonadales bacterium]|nr:class I SAM-dependent methyltransferase [Candidatus Saccharimonadales bacterium]
MGKVIDKKRALSFKDNAQLYEKVRPGYPDTWISDLQEVVKLNKKSKILEVGSGTGKATSDLIKVSKHVTCLDPAKEMLEIAESKFPTLKFINLTFEEFNSDELYDLIISATAWHWVDPAVGYKKAYDLLVESGFMAIIRYYHIDSDPKSFHNRAQYIYEYYNKATSSKRHAEQLNRIKEDALALNNNYFQLVKKFEYKWQVNYSIEDYLALRNTYSDHITMDPADRLKMEHQLKEFAQKEFGGKLTKKYTTVLFIAAKP